MRMLTGIKGEGSMRYGVVRTVAGGVLLAGVLGGCAAGGGKSAAACSDTKKAFQQYVTQVRTVSAAEPGQWRQATEQLAGRLDGLAGTSDGKVRKALKEEADRLRAAAASVGTGDAAQLNTVISETPARIGDACK